MPCVTCIVVALDLACASCDVSAHLPRLARRPVCPVPPSRVCTGLAWRACGLSAGRSVEGGAVVALADLRERKWLAPCHTSPWSRTMA